jgi:hypothetical protein
MSYTEKEIERKQVYRYYDHYSPSTNPQLAANRLNIVTNDIVKSEAGDYYYRCLDGQKCRVNTPISTSSLYYLDATSDTTLISGVAIWEKLTSSTTPPVPMTGKT